MDKNTSHGRPPGGTQGPPGKADTLEKAAASAARSQGRVRESSASGNTPMIDGSAARASMRKKIGIGIAAALVVAAAAAGIGYAIGNAMHPAQPAQEAQSTASDSATGTATGSDKNASEQSAADEIAKSDSTEKEAPKQSENKPSSEEKQAPAEYSENDGHEHVWTEIVKTVKTDAVYETVHHDAVYETVVEDHDICNVCGADITGAIGKHQARTGHKTYTAKVPTSVKKLVRAAYDEKKLKTPAKETVKVVGKKCTLCGKKKLKE